MLLISSARKPMLRPPLAKIKTRQIIKPHHQILKIITSRPVEMRRRPSKFQRRVSCSQGKNVELFLLSNSS
jgi:hypothetical protein